MNSPRVIELPRRLEPVSQDSFVDHGTAVVTELPSQQRTDEQEPPQRAA
jgi:hypothetical protein